MNLNIEVFEVIKHLWDLVFQQTRANQLITVCCFLYIIIKD